MRDLQSKQNGFSHIPRLINPTSSTRDAATMSAARAAEAAAAFPQGAGRRRRRGRGRRDEPEASSAISSSSSAYRNESGGASGEGEGLLYTPPPPLDRLRAAESPSVFSNRTDCSSMQFPKRALHKKRILHVPIVPKKTTPALHWQETMDK